MFPFLYIEKDIQNHPRAQTLIRRFSQSTPVIVEKYGEVFNRQSQNFRLQKQKPSLILAEKKQNLILKIPDGYGIGTANNYYFSHLLNCPFDCRYCFLQGMYSSAHFVFFVNFEDFQNEIEKLANSDTTFFTGYDCDSLAMEGVTNFAKSFLPFIKKSSAFFEFRTKSVQIKPFLEEEVLPNCVISWTLSLEKVQKDVEHKTPTLEKRLLALQELQKKGWLIGLRFDPILEVESWQKEYPLFFEEVFKRISQRALHSVTLGTFRTPKPIFKKMASLYPDEPLFARPFVEKKGSIQTSNPLLLSFCREELLKYIPQEKLFACHE